MNWAIDDRRVRVSGAHNALVSFLQTKPWILRFEGLSYVYERQRCVVLFWQKFHEMFDRGSMIHLWATFKRLSSRAACLYSIRYQSVYCSMKSPTLYLSLSLFLLFVLSFFVFTLTCLCYWLAGVKECNTHGNTCLLFGVGILTGVYTLIKVWMFISFSGIW